MSDLLPLKTPASVRKRERLIQVQKVLAETYPDAHCELNYTTPLELLIATILSAQCTDVQVNKVTPLLFKKYPTVEAIAESNLSELQETIRAIGLYRNKGKNIQLTCRAILAQHQGKVPDTMDELIALPGVGRKTANVVLGNAFRKNVGIVVDTHVARLSLRLGFSSQTDPAKIEAQLLKIIPQPDWTDFSHRLIFHGRRRCRARGPDCPGCELQELCPAKDREMKKRKTADLPS